MKIAVIEAGSLRIDEVESVTLGYLQTQVEGYIEHVHAPHGMSAYVNEEGRLRGLPRNDEASHILGFDVVGNVVFTGGLDPEGEGVGLTQHQIDHLLA